MVAFSNEAEGPAPVEGRDEYGSPAADRRHPDAPALLRPLPPVAEAAPPASSRTSRSGCCLGGVAGLTALTLALVAASHAALPPSREVLFCVPMRRRPRLLHVYTPIFLQYP